MSDGGHLLPMHVEHRPTWGCRACGKPWPCATARRDLAAELTPTRLRIHMWLRLEIAAEDMPDGRAADLFERFLRWTG